MVKIGRKSLGVLNFKVNGKWSIGDFVTWLSNADSAYARLNAFLFISPEFDRKIHEVSFETRRIIHRLPEPYIVRGKEYSEVFTSLVGAALRKAHPLELKKINISSPGTMEFLGSLNPLKVIADFITAWRAENTARTEMERQYATEEMRIKADLMKSLIERADKLTQEGAIQFLEAFIKFALDESLDKLKEIGRDLRITAVTVHEYHPNPSDF